MRAIIPFYQLKTVDYHSIFTTQPEEERIVLLANIWYTKEGQLMLRSVGPMGLPWMFGGIKDGQWEVQSDEPPYEFMRMEYLTMDRYGFYNKPIGRGVIVEVNAWSYPPLHTKEELG